MKHRAFPIVVALGLSGAALSALADSPALQRAEKAAAEVDLSQFFTSRTDARSQSFGFGGTHEHPFSVENAGRYVFTSSTFPGESIDYRIEAALLDARGNVVASGKGLGQNGGLRLVEELEPGDYVLRVSANKFGSEASGGNRFNIEVAGLDASGRRLDSDASGIDSGSGIQFGGPGRDGRTTAFVDKDDDVAAIAAPRASGAAAASRAAEAGDEAADPVFGDQPESLTSQRQSALDVPSPRSDEAKAGGDGTSEQAMPDAFDEIVADIDIRAKGEVLSFDVVEAGTVSITSSTFVGSDTSYRLEARVLDENGTVVASDKAKGFEGDFDIETRLQPGRYTIWVKGQKFGSANSGVNNYTLRVQQLDTQ